MSTDKNNYRENPNRCIYLGEEFSSELLKKLTPEITRLRLASLEPITVYIDSPGGSTTVGENIKRLLKTRDQDGQVRRVITVATNWVASAAADLLISGDYSMAYEHALIHYHGTRATPRKEMLTDEGVELMARNLSSSDASYAERLSQIIIYNLAFLQTAFSDEIEKQQPSKKLGVYEPIEKTAKFIASQLSPGSRDIVKEVIDEIHQYDRLAAHLTDELKDLADGPDRDVKTLQIIITWKHHELSPGETKCEIDEAFLNRVKRSYLDFLRLDRKLFHGEFQRIFMAIGPTLLGEQDAADYAAIPAEEIAKRAVFLNDKGFFPFYILHIFSYALAYRLQRKENTLTAYDAYWLGLINEVVGSQLPNMRDLIRVETQMKIDGL